MDYPKGCKPSGAGIRIQVWRNRQRIYDETIPGDPLDKAFVRQCAKRREWIVERLKHGLPIYQDEQEELTFAYHRQRYLATLSTKPTTRDEYRKLLARYWSDFDGLTISEIDTDRIEDRLSDLGVSVKTQKNALNPLRGVLHKAKVNPNPVDAVTLGKRQRNPVVRYRPDDRAALINKSEGQLRVFLAVLFGTGMRPGEALALEWSDYDGGELIVSKQITRCKLDNSTKTYQWRRVYVPSWCRKILDQHTTRFEGGYIFQNESGGHYCDTKVLRKQSKALHKKLRIPYPDRQFYVCRHTRAAELLSIGIKAPDAASQLGHSVEMFLRIYSEFIEEYATDQDRARFEGLSPTCQSPNRHQKLQKVP